MPEVTVTPQPQHAGLLVHETLAYSYLFYLGAVVTGFLLHRYFRIGSASTVFSIFGGALILLGTAFVYWAQHASKKSSECRNQEDVHHNHFKDGPYKFMRSPTHYGLFFMTLGLALVYQSMLMIVCVFIAFLITRLVFLPREEAELAKKYGAPYLEYKSQVRM